MADFIQAAHDGGKGFDRKGAPCVPAGADYADALASRARQGIDLLRAKGPVGKEGPEIFKIQGIYSTLLGELKRKAHPGGTQHAAGTVMGRPVSDNFFISKETAKGSRKG